VRRVAAHPQQCRCRTASSRSFHNVLSVDSSPFGRPPARIEVSNLRCRCRPTTRLPSPQAEAPAQATSARATERMPIPWLNLILVCKLISSELQHHLQASTNTTYKLEVNNLKLELSQGITDKVTWRQVPCSPSEVRTIQVELVLDWMTQFWNDGGPLSILSALYQALNCFASYTMARCYQERARSVNISTWTH
jgi:hypothetical protein